MIIDKAPCAGCKPPERTPGCHAHCEKYIEWSARNEEYRSKVNCERRKYYTGESISIESTYRHMRRR